MNYESIILELLTRIKTLEEQVSRLQEQVAQLQCGRTAEDRESLSTENAEENAEEKAEVGFSSPSYSKMTDEMVGLCYEYGKAARAAHTTNFWPYAGRIAEQTGMNRNSAFIYVYVFQCMLNGEVYKRAISVRATRYYFDHILVDFGKEALRGAISATEQHVEYLMERGNPCESLRALCREYKPKTD